MTGLFLFLSIVHGLITLVMALGVTLEGLLKGLWEEWWLFVVAALSGAACIGLAYAAGAM